MSRKLALQAVFSVVVQKKSLREFNFLGDGFSQNLTFNTCRYYHYLITIINPLLKKDFNKDDLDVFCILLTASCELIYSKNPDYAVINEWVNLVEKPWAKSLVNAILRKIAINRHILAENKDYSHPKWLVQKLKNSYPDNYKEILIQNNTQALMSIRIDENFNKYITKLENNNITYKVIKEVSNAIVLDKAMQIIKLPDFYNSRIYIQDLSAIRAVNLMGINKNDKVLDVCSAPGGKTTHIANLTKNKIIAIENNKNRLGKLEQNLVRMQIKNVDIICADAKNIKLKTKFDKILIDAPCSATGIIRRQPDIKILRKKTDINKLVQIQAQILENIWQYLKVGGELLYATCSILPSENSEQIINFLAKHKDAKLINLELKSHTNIGVQILPSKYFDGFYYAKIKKIC